MLLAADSGAHAHLYIERAAGLLPEAREVIPHPTAEASPDADGAGNRFCRHLYGNKFPSRCIPAISLREGDAFAARPAFVRTAKAG